MLMMFFSMILTSMVLSFILISITLILSKKKKYQEKLTPFECGFEVMNLIHMPFSMKFFIISIIFLIFDIEIILFLPLILVSSNLSNLTWLTASTIFIFILIWGLMHEWTMNSFQWKS
uniref:NADH-ubiquinone oxidoreductase chain 3 n=1 Tax=Rhipiphorothrips cruentatus TaxID=764491 RepID=A0A8A5L9W8_9NEOP|nr:NADH dehydrogenase subunit 3 [Rhipiphorothrips cruentatus]